MFVADGQRDKRHACDFEPNLAFLANFFNTIIAGFSISGQILNPKNQ
jgi:hypothetical protein